MKKKLLIIGFVWPEPSSSAAGSRMMQLIAAFLSDDYLITFASTASESEHAVDLGTFDVETQIIKLNDASFDEFIKELQPDLVMFDRFMTEEQFGWRVAEQCPTALRILDTEDLHSLRKTRQECYNNNIEFTSDIWLKADITKREIASIYRCDIALIISKYEMHLLQDIVKIDLALLYYLPFMLDTITEADSIKLPTYEDRAHFITIGNFRHVPNYDAVRYLKEIIWPLIRQTLPKAEMHIYGAYPMQKVTQLHNEKEGFLIKGWADDVNTVMQNARVCLAPIRFGAGLKGKFFDAMKNGTPNITTSIGAEGFSEEFNGYVEDEPTILAEKAVELYSNHAIWKTMHAKGFKTINEQFNTKKLRVTFLSNMTHSIKNIEALRKKNFIGAMLQHQTLQSTRYMSKWIEEKNG